MEQNKIQDEIPGEMNIDMEKNFILCIIGTEEKQCCDAAYALMQKGYGVWAPLPFYNVIQSYDKNQINSKGAVENQRQFHLIQTLRMLNELMFHNAGYPSRCQINDPEECPSQTFEKGRDQIKYCRQCPLGQIQYDSHCIVVILPDIFNQMPKMDRSIQTILNFCQKQRILMIPLTHALTLSYEEWVKTGSIGDGLIQKE